MHLQSIFKAPCVVLVIEDTVKKRSGYIPTPWGTHRYNHHDLRLTLVNDFRRALSVLYNGLCACVCLLHGTMTKPMLITLLCISNTQHVIIGV